MHETSESIGIIALCQVLRIGRQSKRTYIIGAISRYHTDRYAVHSRTIICCTIRIGSYMQRSSARAATIRVPHIAPNGLRCLVIRIRRSRISSCTIFPLSLSSRSCSGLITFTRTILPFTPESDAPYDLFCRTRSCNGTFRDIAVRTSHSIGIRCIYFNNIRNTTRTGCCLQSSI